jgi:hypothetical protein
MPNKPITMAVLVCLYSISMSLCAELPSTPLERTSELSVREIMGAWSGLRTVNYEHVIDTRKSWAASLDYGIRTQFKRLDGELWSDEYSTWGLGAAYYWHFGEGVDLNGWYAGPVMHIGIKTLSDTGSGTNTSGYLDAGGESGYRWVFQNGFGIDVGLVIGYTTSEFAPLNLGPTLGLGYAF